jgi:hypothetical protein
MIQFLKVNKNYPNFIAPEGVWRVPLEQITEDTLETFDAVKLNKLIDDSGSYVLVNEKLNLIQGYKRVNVAKGFGDKYIVVKVVDTRECLAPVHPNPKVFPRLISKLKLPFKNYKEFCTGNCFTKEHVPTCKLYNLVKSIKEHGVLNPILINENDEVVEGERRFFAAFDAGLHVIPCIKAEKYPFPNTTQWLSVASDPAGCPVFPGDTPINTYTWTGDTIVKKKTSPVSRGKVLCLEPGCKTWIKGKGSLLKGRKATDYFCKKHHFDSKNPSNLKDYDTMPLRDRENDPIWIKKDYDILKIKNMDDGHLTNTLAFLERNAKVRCSAEGIPESKWLTYVTPRYDYLIAEAKRRSEKNWTKKCNCENGWTTDDFPCYCEVGKQRVKAISLAKEIEQVERKSKIRKYIEVIIIAFVLGATCEVLHLLIGAKYGLR